MQFLTSIFGPDHGDLLVWQMALRGCVIFLFCALLIRIMCRRAFGMSSYLDIALAVLIGSILSRAVTGAAPLAGTLAASAAIAVCYWALVQLAQRFHTVGWIVKGAPRTLVRAGQPDRRAMRAVGVSDADLQEAAHQVQLPDLSRIETAVLERSGRITVLPKT